MQAHEPIVGRGSAESRWKRLHPRGRRTPRRECEKKAYRVRGEERGTGQQPVPSWETMPQWSDLFRGMRAKQKNGGRKGRETGTSRHQRRESQAGVEAYAEDKQRPKCARAKASGRGRLGRRHGQRTLARDVWRKTSVGGHRGGRRSRGSEEALAATKEPRKSQKEEGDNAPGRSRSRMDDNEGDVDEPTSGKTTSG